MSEPSKLTNNANALLAKMANEMKSKIEFAKAQQASTKTTTTKGNTANTNVRK